MQRRLFKLPGKLHRKFAAERFVEDSEKKTMLSNLDSNLNKLRDARMIENDFADRMYRIVEKEDKLETVRKEFRDFTLRVMYSNSQVIKAILVEATALINKYGHNEDLLVEVLETVARIEQTRGPNMTIPDDLSGAAIFYDHRFEQFIELFKYYLVYGNYISSKNIAKTLRSLAKLGYKDIEIQRMVQKKLMTSRYIETSEIDDKLEAAGYSDTELAALPLINKKGFYSRKTIGDLDIQMSQTFNHHVQHLLNIQNDETYKRGLRPLTEAPKRSEKVLKVAENVKLAEIDRESYSLLKQRHQNWSENEANVAEQSQVQVETDPQVIEIDEAMAHLEELINQEKEGLVKVTDSILKLRSLYSQLGKLQKEQFVYENTSLMADLMEFEERLIELGIISPAEIKRFARDGDVPSENRRLSLSVKQAIHNLGGSVEVLESIQQPDLVSQTATKSTLRTEKGMYSYGLPDALAALSEYAFLECRDIKALDTYVESTIAQVVNPNQHKEEHLYKTDLHPLMGLRELYFDPIVDKKKLTTASPIYMKSTHEFVAYYQSLLTFTKGRLITQYRNLPLQLLQLSYVATKAGHSQTIAQLNSNLSGIVSISNYDFDRLCKLFFKTNGNPYVLFGTPANREEFSNVLFNLFETLDQFAEKPVSRKVDILYSMALCAQANKSFTGLFKNFYTTLMDNHHLFEEMCSNYGNHWVPLPERVYKMQIVDMAAQSLDLPRSPSVTRMLSEMDMSKKMSYGTQDQRDPIFDSLKDFVRNIFGNTIDSTTQALANRKICPEVLPIGEVFTKFNYSVMIYLRDSADFADGQNISIGCELESTVLQNYFAKMLHRNVKVINIPHSVFLKNGGKPSADGKVELLEEDKLQITIRNIYDTILNGGIRAKHRNNLILLAQDADSRSEVSHLMTYSWFSNLSRLLKALSASMSQISEGENIAVSKDLKNYINDLRSGLSDLETTNIHDISQILDTTEKIKVSVYKISHSINRSSITFKKVLLSQYGKLKLPKLISKLIETNEQIAEWASDLSHTPRREGQLTPPVFASRRQGVDLIDFESHIRVKEVDPVEFFNYEMLRNPDFFNYKDWARKVAANLPAFEHLADTSKTIPSEYGQIVAGLNPSRLPEVAFIHPSNYSLYWQFGSFAKRFDSTERYPFIDDVVGKSIEDCPEFLRSELAYILNLESLKFNLKNRKDLGQALDQITGLGLFRSLHTHFVSTKTTNEASKYFKNSLIRLTKRHGRADKIFRKRSRYGQNLLSILESEKEVYTEELKKKEEKKDAQ